ncbi:MAG TPA: prepilin peptidase [Xanthobacteraceae bacterium]|jgi:preprotein translocase subunit SecA|nr:prepilin peptidase [Xanthobacteraceae bacterium]
MSSLVSELTLPSAAVPRPLRLYPERIERAPQPLDFLTEIVGAEIAARASARRVRALSRIVSLVEEHTDAFRALALDDFPPAVREVALALRRAGDLPDREVARAFALIRELSARVLGKRHFGVQMMGAFAMLKGWLAEMATGEGKTLTATLTAGTAALAGFPVHVVTVNDYLARRDAEQMGPLYRQLGLTVGVVLQGQSAEERRAAYRCDITYCTNKELAFDYLRDRILLGQADGDLTLKLEAMHSEAPRARALRLRGLHFAIVDEADSVLIDEARTPLIISGLVESTFDADTIAAALELARELAHGQDYFISLEERRVFLTASGQSRIAAFGTARGGAWRSVVAREELARQALSALHLFKPGEQYVVSDGKVKIVDEYTGRIMPDRQWSDGLHQMIEHKEGCALSARRATIARITYQRFFRRYRRLSGMSGTLRPVARELWRVYRLPVASIPTHRPIKRRHLPDEVVATEAEKWRAILARVTELHQKGVPVLIGTRSVAASERAGAALTAAGLPHTVLNATQDKHEADIIALAGGRGRITVATNMAGRGTDIHIDEDALKLGGLHVIMTERHDARRIDDQLAGRSGRQGEPGCFQAILSLEDPLMDFEIGPILSRLAAPALRRWGPSVGRIMLRMAQRRAEWLHARMRADLLQSDRSQSKTLAFSGRPE